MEKTADAIFENEISHLQVLAEKEADILSDGIEEEELNMQRRDVNVGKGFFNTHVLAT